MTREVRAGREGRGQLLEEAVLIILATFGSIFGGVMGIIHVSGRNRIQVLREKRLLAEAQRPLLPPAVPVADPHAAPVLALQLPEPQRSAALALLSRLADAPASLDARSRYIIAQTQGEYLPETLRGYVNLQGGARRQLEAQGLNPEALLGEQLALMDQGVQDALRLDHEAADRVLTQGRFLRERFRWTGSPETAGDGSTPPHGLLKI
ncbi:hypothetical protein [Deinococcus hopiensis]|uniref:Uncharacterized protein n=1 Tax=Deinococcus hopiensis KR-140 TaxID=695939 RepID=A0A1W1VDT5_9DEIO|nr:hypothetical protein [Deinococcus hopiensis]SMB91360.1 hypothetical protein SAMN00790413_01105 [Deinococcus hopiensis KR-140]